MNITKEQEQTLRHIATTANCNDIRCEKCNLFNYSNNSGCMLRKYSNEKNLMSAENVSSSRGRIAQTILVDVVEYHLKEFLEMLE